MTNLNNIINIKDHPLEDFNYIKLCKSKISNNSLLILKNFLSENTLKELVIEALELENKAFYCSQKHTILLGKYNKFINKLDPTNIEVKSDKGCVPHDLLKENSKLNIIYKSSIFKNFLKSVLNLKNLYSYDDNLSSINYNYYQKNQQLGWHFDNASFAITLMIQSADDGGDFEYVTNGRDYRKNFIDKKYISEILTNSIETNKLNADAGTLILFYGRDYLHRVTPVKSLKPRILVTLNYNEEEGIKLSENARLTFFGRIH